MGMQTSRKVSDKEGLKCCSTIVATGNAFWWRIGAPGQLFAHGRLPRDYQEGDVTARRRRGDPRRNAVVH